MNSIPLPLQESDNLFDILQDMDKAVEQKKKQSGTKKQKVVESQKNADNFKCKPKQEEESDNSDLENRISTKKRKHKRAK